MPRRTLSWSKPVTTKLRKKSLSKRISDTNAMESADHVPRVTGSARDSWSFVSISGSNRAPSDGGFEVVSRQGNELHEDFEAVPQKFDNVANELALQSLDFELSASSSDPDWNFVDVGPSREQDQPDNPFSVAKPSITIEPPTPSSQDETAGPSETRERTPSLLPPVSSRCGCGRHWAKSVDLEEVEEQLKQLKVDQRSLRGASRNHFQEREKQLNDLQKERWDVESSRDAVEKNIEEHKEVRAEETASLKNRMTFEDVQQMRNALFIPDEEIYDEELFYGVNRRERAIISSRGKAAQRKRVFGVPSALQSSIEGRLANPPLHNQRGDFPYKPFSFVHVDIPSIYDRNGEHVGHIHRQVASHKKRQIAFQKNSKEEALTEIGKLQPGERWDAVTDCEKYTQTLDLERKTRVVQPKWYTKSQVEYLIGKGRTEGEVRHDSVADQP